MRSDKIVCLDSKRALVTGAGQGIGRGCAIELARAGADLILNDRPGSRDLVQTAEDVRAMGRQCWTVEADVFSPSGCVGLIDSAIRQASEIDILISNPAYGRQDGFLDFSASEFDKVIDATFKSGFHIAQAMARHRVEVGGGGKILFITSVMAEMPFEGSTPYCAAKAAMNQLTQNIAVELFAHRINVNAIEPGWIDTPSEREKFSDEVVDSGGADLPWGRLGTPTDIGRAAAFLVSDAADYITGVVLPVDGGFRFKDMRSVSQVAPQK
ncbi:SDR family NAD(P)-dependent oxidoreductase [Allorhodopirellula solitaria]|uniref:2-dehydro-3-deoxy-D-gluconate 5-dehydrogenase n=1 Tax=Allorhodopirellula solitaria TaxID=2527987 RepID=A0A5C5XUQ8_9BACT|nr:SDR family oxidoreductase [Allorhodopirellula solitaria]TWT65332.1 2-dehydro-3-deoxy-D-gluconate 5-dehydrogenase [Allorhodopirellula solitaria]